MCVCIYAFHIFANGNSNSSERKKKKTYLEGENREQTEWCARMKNACKSTFHTFQLRLPYVHMCPHKHTHINMETIVQVKLRYLSNSTSLSFFCIRSCRMWWCYLYMTTTQFTSSTLNECAWERDIISVPTKCIHYKAPHVAYAFFTVMQRNHPHIPCVIFSAPATCALLTLLFLLF